MTTLCNSASQYEGSDLDYGIDWYYQGDPPWLLLTESIIESTWEVLDDDGTLEIHGATFTETGTLIWARGGTPGRVYVLVNRIRTDQGRSAVARIELRIKRVD